MPLKAALGDKELTAIAVYVGANPRLRPCEINRWIMDTYKVGKATAYAARAKLKKLAPTSSVDKVSAVVLDTPDTVAVAVDAPPVSPVEMRARIISELYHTMLNSPRPDDRVASGKELSRLLGFHREDLQDKFNEIDLRKEDPVGRCRRIALEFRKAIGMPIDDIPEVLRRLNPEMPNDTGGSVPSLPEAIPDRPLADETGAQVAADRPDVRG